MLLVYLFALVVGGGLLGASIVLGGHHDATAGTGGADVHAGAGGHDAHAAGHGTHEAGAPVLDAFWLMFLSIRFWTFFLAFFGLTGVLLGGLHLVEFGPAVFVVALGMGLASGAGIHFAMRAVSGGEASSAVRIEDYIGRSARVLLSVQKGQLGKARLFLKGESVDIVVTTDETGALEANEEAMIVEMRGTTAVLARPESKGAS